MVRRRSVGGGIGARLVIALVIAAVSIISFLSTRTTNDITGETQYVDLSPEEEIVLGLQAVPEMVQEYGGELQDENAAYVREIGQRIVAANGLAERTAYRFDFHLLRDQETVNAFALPGGQVFITAALYSALETEGQLAGVLGHEVGHVVARHSSEQLAKQKLTQGLINATGAATDLSGAQIAAAIGQMINLRYGRGDELEADRLGVRFMAEAGYDPRALIGVMEILERASGGAQQPEFFSTHPNPANRIAEIQAAIEKAYPDGVPDGLTP